MDVYITYMWYDYEGNGDPEEAFLTEQEAKDVVEKYNQENQSRSRGMIYTQLTIKGTK